MGRTEERCIGTAFPQKLGGGTAGGQEKKSAPRLGGGHALRSCTVRETDVYMRDNLVCSGTGMGKKGGRGNPADGVGG